MKLLILGGTGTISREIVRQALQAGHSVTVFNRGTREVPLNSQVRAFIGDRHDTALFSKLPLSAEADVVIDMICFCEADARQTLQTFGGHVRQIIFTSSIAAYDRPYRSYPIREDAECLRTGTSFSYGFQKAEMERYLQGEMQSPLGVAITILRPSFTFGDGTANFGILRQNRNVVSRIQQGKPLVMTGEGEIPWTFTFAPDLAAAYLLACGNPKTYNDCFHVTNTELVMWEDLYYAVGRAVGQEPQLCYVPSVLLQEFDPALCGHLHYEKVHFSYFSIEKFQRAAPTYVPKVKLNEGIARLVQWWEASDFPFDEEKDLLEDRICSLYGQFRQDLLSLRPHA